MVKSGRGSKFPEWKWERLLDMVFAGLPLEGCAEILEVSPEVIEKEVQGTLQMSFAEWVSIVEKRIKRKVILAEARKGDQRVRDWLKRHNLLKDDE